MKILFVAFIISFAIGFYLHGNNFRIVELRKDGFYPSRITIAKGDNVVFLNKTGKPFWPASNPHPIHTIYSDFDSKRPIDQGKKWTFRFEKEGIFNYHDHLSPFFQGQIIVGQVNNYSLSESNCTKMVGGNQRTCFENLLQSTLNKRGLDEGFRLFRQLAKIAPNDCHQYAHDLGGYVYKMQSKRQDKIKAGLETSYCGYGFWHGFMGKMLTSSSFERATKFCESQLYAPNELSLRVKESCYHGIGIGLVPDPPDIKFWGKPQPLLDKSLHSCDKIKNKNLLSFCYSGAFHAVISYMTGRQYDFKIDITDPFAICFSQIEQYRKDCFFQIAPQLSGLTHNNLSDTLKVVKRIPDPYFENTAMLSLINFTSQKDSNDEYLQFIAKCQKRDSRISDLCIPAVIVSIFNSGTPDEEYVKAVTLCSSKAFSENDKKGCFRRILISSRDIYEGAKVKKICATFENKYSKICN